MPKKRKIVIKKKKPNPKGKTLKTKKSFLASNRTKSNIS